MPSVAAQAVPSEAKASAGSDWKARPGASGSSVLLQVVPESVEKNCFCRPEAPMLFEAAVRNCGLT